MPPDERTEVAEFVEDMKSIRSMLGYALPGRCGFYLQAAETFNRSERQVKSARG